MTVQGRSTPRHVLVGAGPDTPLGQAAAAIAEALGEPGAALYQGPRILDPKALLADAGLYEGGRVAFASQADDAVEPPPLLELHAVSGFGAGAIHPLAAGRYSVGSAQTCAIRIPGAAALAAEITVTPDGDVSVSAHDGAALVGVVAPQPAPEPKPQRGEPIIPRPRPPVDSPPPGAALGALRWPADADLVVGDTVLRWAEPTPPDSAVQPTQDGVGLDFNRPPRILEPVPQSRHRIPKRPVFRGRNPFPMVMVIAPAVMGVGMALFLHNLFYSMFALFSPVFAVANWTTSRRSGRRNYKRDLAAYYVSKAEKERALDAAVRAERVLRLELTADPAAVRRIATGPGSRLWERRRHDPDHLVLRIGTADQPSMLEVEDADRGGEFNERVRWSVPGMPVGFGLADRGVVGLAGPPERIRPLAGWLLAQIATLHSPHGVRIAILTDPDRAADWEWLRWLPHLRSPYAPVLLIGNDPETVGYRLSELTGTLARRQEAAKSPMGRAVFADPDLVVLVDGARRMRDLPGMMQLLAEGPRMRMFFICVDGEMRMLPKEATSVVVDDGERLTLRQDGLPEFAGIRPDLADPDWFEEVARALAPLRDATIDEGGVLPDRLRLTELLGLDAPDAEVIAARWQARPSSTVAQIGMGYDGPLAIDLAQDGPHALIGGTTGSGKSELLQTLVASLAVANRPDELTFLLIDYKGGSAFRDCVDLPHTLGMVTDLDGHLVNRVLESLAAELRRRERLLAEYGAKDQPDYLAKRRLEPAMPPLPRLLLIVDEFASLVREVPEFIPGMVSLAQRGRSLGIHLVLATQRPAGVVSPDIKANTNLRIALRVLDPLESKDVIDTGDAALIPANLPGRALVRLSHRSVAAFQTAYSGAPYLRAQAPVTPATAVELPWLKLGRPDELPHPQRGASAPETEHAAFTEYAETDLSMLVQAVRLAAQDLKIEPQPRPWLPELPERVTLAQLPALTVAEDRPEVHAELPPITIGIEDLPSVQQQRPVTLDLKTFTHLAILGTARSGRTQALRTVAGALAERYTTAEVHMYAVDAAGGGLSVLDALPHTGAVVGRADLERVDRLLTRLTTELTRRQELLAEHHSNNLTELRAAMPPGPRPGHLLLFADGWESLHATIHEHDNGRLLDDLFRLLREGAAAGIHVVLAGDRGLANGRMSNLIEHRLMLRMSDKNDFMLLGMRSQDVPTRVSPGRAWQSGQLVEMQIALLDDDPSGQAQAEALRRIGRTAQQRDAGTLAVNRPFTVGKLPLGIDFAAAYRQLPEAKPLVGLIGIGADETGPVTVDFSGRGYAFVVAGPSGSGRSNTLATLAISLLASRTRLLIVTPRESPLRRLAADPQVRVLAHAQPDGRDIEAALEELGGPCVVLVDDVDLLAHVLGVDGALRTVIRTGRDRGIGLALAGSAEVFLQNPGTWIAEARRSRQGVLLQPQSLNEGDLIGGRLPLEIVRRPLKLGRGYVAHPATGAATAVALPVTELKGGDGD
ncbi:cell division protein FtsK [Actinospica durhamensis]|uniref:Cell division protein FtsK n=1 Tax=Actinospica durhamensis TaxID=1508375 RepID=A0A941EJC4_9ACTN|nr:FtsK/SpoIIIE domain-containing protein [Actinospica durhamensis]MBR7831820.1 cell division protein FtsK [Actinospica durhamensis]